MHRSSTPGAYYQVIKPVLMAIKLNKQVNDLMDVFDHENDVNLRIKAYNKALYLAKKSNKLLGYSS